MSLQAFTEGEADEFRLAARIRDELASIPHGYQLEEHEFTGMVYFKQLVALGEVITPRQVNYRLRKLVQTGALLMKKETIGRNETNVYWWPGEGADDTEMDGRNNGNGAAVVSAEGSGNEGS